jgi:hypothetical protein
MLFHEGKQAFAHLLDLVTVFKFHTNSLVSIKW